MSLFGYLHWQNSKLLEDIKIIKKQIDNFIYQPTVNLVASQKDSSVYVIENSKDDLIEKFEKDMNFSMKFIYSGMLWSKVF